MKAAEKKTLASDRPDGLPEDATHFDPLDSGFTDHDSVLRVREAVRLPDGGRLIVYEGDFVGYVNLTEAVRRSIGITSRGSNRALGFALMTPQVRAWIDNRLREIR